MVEVDPVCRSVFGNIWSEITGVRDEIQYEGGSGGAAGPYWLRRSSRACVFSYRRKPDLLDRADRDERL